MINGVSEFVRDALTRKSAGHRASQAVLWGSLNSIVLTVILYDLQTGGYSHGSAIVWWCASFICIVCSLNIITHLNSYITLIFSLAPLEVNEKQQKLLSVTDSDIGFKSPLPSSNSASPAVPDRTPKLSELYEATIRTPPPPQPLHSSSLSTPNKSWYGGSTSPQNLYGPFSSSPAQNLYTSYVSSNSSLFSDSSFSPVLYASQGGGNTTSPSVTADSWSFHRNQSSIFDRSYSTLYGPKRDVFNASQLSDSLLGKKRSPSFSPANVGHSSTSPVLFSSSFTDRMRNSVTTKDDLNLYIKEFNEKEKKRQILSQTENGNGGSNSLWAYGSSNALDALSTLRKTMYQPAIKDTGQESSLLSNKNEDYKTASLSSSSVSKIWLKRNVNPKQLFQYEENLRIWLSQNVLQPLVHLIDLSNEAIAATAPELQIGNVGVDKLKKAAQNISGVKQLHNLLPFLDVTIHQDYLVQRLRDLSKGGAISSYQWNAGGSFNGKAWREEYPTDTYILLHLFAMYMDSHLPPDPTQPDGRVFSNVHIVKTPEKPPKPAVHPCLYLTQMNPPHLKVILPEEEECDVGAGHKNFLHSLLLFCHHLVHQQHSHIAGINLDLSGINLAWVLHD